MQDLIETEQQRLYQSANLTDNLEDEDAKTLLSWASTQVAVIAGRAGSFESNCKSLRKMVKDINYFIGNVEDLDSDEQLEELNRLYESATDLDYPTREDMMDALVDELDGASPTDMLDMILAWIMDKTDEDDDEPVEIPDEPIALLEIDIPDELIEDDRAGDESDHEDNSDDEASLDDDNDF